MLSTSYIMNEWIRISAPPRQTATLCPSVLTQSNQLTSEFRLNSQREPAHRYTHVPDDLNVKGLRHIACTCTPSYRSESVGVRQGKHVELQLNVVCCGGQCCCNMRPQPSVAVCGCGVGDRQKDGSQF